MNLKELFLAWIDFTPKQERAENTKPKKTQLFGIDADLFHQNLRITQKYCQLQQETGEKKSCPDIQKYQSVCRW